MDNKPIATTAADQIKPFFLIHCETYEIFHSQQTNEQASTQFKLSLSLRRSFALRVLYLFSINFALLNFSFTVYYFFSLLLSLSFFRFAIYNWR